MAAQVNSVSFMTGLAKTHCGWGFLSMRTLHSLAHFLVATTLGGKRHPFYREAEEAKARPVLTPRGRLGTSVPGAPLPCRDSHLPEFRGALPRPRGPGRAVRSLHFCRPRPPPSQELHYAWRILPPARRYRGVDGGRNPSQPGISQMPPRRGPSNLRLGRPHRPGKTTLPRRLRGRACSRRQKKKMAALSEERPSGWVSSQSCSTGTRTRSIQRTTGPLSACFLSTMAPEPRNYTCQKNQAAAKGLPGRRSVRAYVLLPGRGPPLLGAD